MHKKRTVKSADQRRAELLEAALVLFDQKGFDATTVGDIAKTAGMAPGTVYLYFESKEHILRELHLEYHHTMQTDGQAAVDTQLTQLGEGTIDTRQAIDAVVDAIVGSMVKHRRATNVICRYMPRLADQVSGEDREMVEFIAQSTKAAVAAGYFDTSNPDMTAHLIKACIYDPVTRAIVYGDPPLKPLVAQIKEVFYRALAPQAPREA